MNQAPLSLLGDRLYVLQVDRSIEAENSSISSGEKENKTDDGAVLSQAELQAVNLLHSAVCFATKGQDLDFKGQKFSFASTHRKPLSATTDTNPDNQPPKDSLRATLLRAMHHAAKIHDRIESPGCQDLAVLMNSDVRWVDVLLENAGKEVLPGHLLLAMCYLVSDTSDTVDQNVICFAIRALLAMRTQSNSTHPGSKLKLDKLLLGMKDLGSPFEAVVKTGALSVVSGMLLLPSIYGLDVNLLLHEDKLFPLHTICEQSWGAGNFEQVLNCLLRRCSPAQLNDTPIHPHSANVRYRPFLHKLLDHLWDGLTHSSALAERLIVLCCSEEMCPSNGAGLDPSISVQKQNQSVTMMTMEEKLKEHKSRAVARVRGTIVQKQIAFAQTEGFFRDLKESAVEITNAASDCVEIASRTAKAESPDCEIGFDGMAEEIAKSVRTTDGVCKALDKFRPSINKLYSTMQNLQPAICKIAELQQATADVVFNECIPLARCVHAIQNAILRIQKHDKNAGQTNKL